MVLPPPQRLWVGMLVVIVAVAELPGSLQKCIFDEVQAQARVVRAAPIHTHVPPNEPRLRWRASPLPSLSVRRRRSLGKRATPTSSSPQPIRIQSWIQRESNNLWEEEKQRLEAAMEEAVRVVSSLLSVNRVPGPLLLSRDINKYCKFLWRNSSIANYNRCGRANNNYRSETCLDVTIPDDHLAGCDIYTEADSPRRTELRPDGAGLPDTDFLMYLHVQATDKCRSEPSVLAYAVHCQTDAHGRPVAGVVVICRDRLTGATYNHQATVQTVIHELFHALGFSKHLFHTWRDCSSTSPVGANCSPRGKVTHSDESGQMRIYTPSVISALQKHLASADPELGGPLENLDVPAGRVSSHWESRVLQGSIMAAVLGDSTTVRIDSATLAALQDTGWYTVNLSRAQSLVWGDGEGATFGSLSTCQDRSSSFFCTGSGFGCHYLHLHKGECQTDQYLEGCRVYKPFQNGSECWKEENGRKSAEEVWSGEIFGFDSRCFFSNLTRQSPSLLFSSPVEGRCYRHRCTGPNGYQIQVSGSEWVDCPAGGTIQIKGYQGLVSCPDRRLCLYPDVTPPSDNVITFPASITSDPYETLTSAQNGTWAPLRPPTELTVATALGITAAVCLLAAVVVSYRKCCSCRVRIHSAPEHHSDL
ncbi:ciliated left-right organizer metallopeptidase isoform X2 [Dicentrarchus labrax]|uniref:ciliated left-right organizer metallopeptidase isoform X2 n=1 Tax=Dicentrarchus labrax TaxID=13489 RepID=UPI0021F5F845|nr:ciliated left-right organizer metallopeptidase isoform X2 [Dicentrarchus labrax]